ncbi:MAG TPA: hypothetical protein VNQ73_08775 [Ilumatobacter sp.]|nr:hypothetical protein [Ilumatobacter sp.]
MTAAARYRFGDPGRVGVVLGMSLRQTVPIVAGVLWLTLWMVAGMPLVGAVGPLAGCLVSFGRWKRAPLFEVAGPGARLAVARLSGRAVWRRPALPSRRLVDGDVPDALRGIEIVDAEVGWNAASGAVGVVRDRAAGTLSMVLPVSGGGFPVASPAEQDGIVAAWGAALAPIARARSPISRVTWQEWCHPVGVDGHRRVAHVHGSGLAGGECLGVVGGFVEAGGGELAERRALLAVGVEDAGDRAVRADPDPCRGVVLADIGQQEQHKQCPATRCGVGPPLEDVGSGLPAERGVDVPAGVAGVVGGWEADRERAEPEHRLPRPGPDQHVVGSAEWGCCGGGPERRFAVAAEPDHGAGPGGGAVGCASGGVPQDRAAFVDDRAGDGAVEADVTVGSESLGERRRRDGVRGDGVGHDVGFSCEWCRPRASRAHCAAADWAGGSVVQEHREH